MLTLEQRKIEARKEYISKQVDNGNYNIIPGKYNPKIEKKRLISAKKYLEHNFGDYIKPNKDINELSDNNKINDDKKNDDKKTSKIKIEKALFKIEAETEYIISKCSMKSGGYYLINKENKDIKNSIKKINEYINNIKIISQNDELISIKIKSIKKLIKELGGIFETEENILKNEISENITDIQKGLKRKINTFFN